MVQNIRTCVVADRQSSSRNTIKDILTEKCRFDRVVICNSLDQMRDNLETATSVELIIVDLAVPGMFGSASILTLREQYPVTKIAVFSGSERREDILNTLAAGGHGFIPKSLPKTEMHAAIEGILDGLIFVPSSLAQVTCSRGIESVFKSPNRLLTRRQREVLQLVVQGKKNREIASAFEIDESTVKIHLNAIFRSLNVSSRGEAAASAVILGILDVTAQNNLPQAAE